MKRPNINYPLIKNQHYVYSTNKGQYEIFYVSELSHAKVNPH